MISERQKLVKHHVTKKEVLRGSEEFEQACVIQWARFWERKYPELKYLFHVPNGGSRNAREAANLKAAGVVAGIPDLILPVRKEGYGGLYIEMKVEPNKPTERQIDVMEALAGFGNKVAVCYGQEEAKREIAEYLGMGENTL